MSQASVGGQVGLAAGSTPSPLQPADDMLGHQSVDRLSRPAVADTEHSVFTERYWYLATNAPTGDLVISAGLGYYPNRGVMDGYAGVTLDGVQHVVQVSRHTADDPLTPCVGPLRITIGRGLGEHRIKVAPNDSGVTMDLNYRAQFMPNDEGFDRVEKNGKTLAAVSRFVQFGRYVGWVEVLGRRFEFDEPDALWGCRDRSWGLRVEANTDETKPPLTRFNPLFFVWACAQFADSGIHIFFKESAPGAPRFLVGDETYPPGSGRAPRAITRIDHELDWFQDPYAQLVRGGTFTLQFADGEVKVLRVRPLGGRFYLKGGLYGGLRGWSHGDDKGAFHIGHGRWDLNVPDSRRELRTLTDQIMEFDDGTRRGYGTVQAGLAKGYPKYPQIQDLPFM